MAEYFDHIGHAKTLLEKQAEINQLRKELDEVTAQLAETSADGAQWQSRAETAETQLKAVMQYTHEIGEVQAGLPSPEAAVARAGYWHALQKASAENARKWQERAETAEHELAELRAQIGTPADPDDVFEPGHTYRSHNGYFEFHCERRIGEYALGIETVLEDWTVRPGTRFRMWASIGPAAGYIDVTGETPR